MVEQNKFCRNCGTSISKEAAVCVKCGFSQNINPKFCRECGAAVPEGAAVCLKCGTAQKGGAAPSAPGTGGQMDLSNLFGSGPKNPTVAAVLSIVPGLGQAYNGELVPKGVAIFVAYVICIAATAFLVFIGFFTFVTFCCALVTAVAALGIWAFAVYDAYTTCQKLAL